MEHQIDDDDDPAASREPEILPPILAGRYRLDEQIGRGGFGRVYRGFDSMLQRTIAIKVFDLRAGFRSGPVEAYLDEAKKLAQFHHPGVVPVHDAGRDGDRGFLITELRTAGSI